MNRSPRVVVAGLKGGSGKTTLSLGLLGAFRQRGLKPLAFKKGPDYIDAAWLAAASGAPCYNLDPFLIGEENILPSYISRAAGADICLIEGNRGIFDGMDLQGSQSTARLAELLKAPVVLVMDASKMTRTAAALVLGIMKFDPGLALGGVVLNQVAGARHEAMLRGSIERYTGLNVLGAIPRFKNQGGPDGGGLLSERHMGLLAYQEHPEAQGAIETAVRLITKSVDVEGILRIARSAPPIRAAGESVKTTGRRAATKRSGAGVVIGVLRDSAFQFYYPENLEALEALGAGLKILSPLSEKGPLPDMDALYVGGGFPETHAVELSRNRAFLRALKGRIEQGLPVYAECGGLMYLASHIELNGGRFPMAGVFPFGITLEKRPVAHGYSVARVCAKNAFYPRGAVLRGHEFHYSNPARLAGKALPGVEFALKMERGTGIEGGMDGLVYKNVFATYTHTHALGTPEWARGMLAAAKNFRKKGAAAARP
ncbi:MAG: cobyrinate a,c-diamide synthase [Nitrospiraceae bacterium]|nr:cobyrinate a,c-diamide synthase [Nitrospiraceae bacterium]